MRNVFKKLLPVLLLAILLLSACAEKYEHNHNEPTDTTATSSPICQHTFTTTVVNEYRDATETHHSCYEVETRVCENCGFTEKNETFLCTEHHELGEVHSYEPDGNGDLIFHGICAGCKEHVSIYP